MRNNINFKKFFVDKTVVYINSFASKEEHSQVNASFLLMLSLICKSINYYGNSDSLKVMKNILGPKMPNNLTKHSLFVYPGQSRISLLFRYIISAISNILLLISNRKGIIFYNFDNVFSIRIINWLNKFLHREVIILCHGELELLRKDINKEGLLQQMIMYLVRNFYNKKLKVSDTLYFIVLGDSIKNNLSTFLTESQMTHFFSIDHPYISLKRNVNINPKVKSDKLKLGCVGSMNEFKGALRLIELSEKIKEYGLDVELSVIGKVYSHRELMLSHNIILKSKENLPIPTDEFHAYINELDAILFLYDSNSYKMTASGAIYDSIIFSKPIITLKNDYFDNIITKYEIPALIATDIDDILSKIELIQNYDKYTITDKFKSALAKISPENQVEALFFNLDRIGFV